MAQHAHPCDSSEEEEFHPEFVNNPPDPDVVAMPRPTYRERLSIGNELGTALELPKFALASDDSREVSPTGTNLRNTLPDCVRDFSELSAVDKMRASAYFMPSSLPDNGSNDYLSSVVLCEDVVTSELDVKPQKSSNFVAKKTPPMPLDLVSSRFLSESADTYCMDLSGNGSPTFVKNGEFGKGAFSAACGQQHQQHSPGASDFRHLFMPDVTGGNSHLRQNGASKAPFRKDEGDILAISVYKDRIKTLEIENNFLRNKVQQCQTNWAKSENEAKKCRIHAENLQYALASALEAIKVMTNTRSGDINTIENNRSTDELNGKVAEADDSIQELHLSGKKAED